MYCKNCGRDLEPGAQRCRRCGAPVPPPGQEPEEPKLADTIKDKAKAVTGHRYFWPGLCLGLAALVLILALILIFSSGRAQAPQPAPEPTSEPSPVATLSPTPQPEPTPEPSPEPGWAEVYKSFLEGDPSVNSQMLKGSVDMGFEGTVTAQLFALADVTGDGEPELLLARQPESLPGWNVDGDRGKAVERFIVCHIQEGRVSPLMCLELDFRFFPLALSVEDQWIMTAHQGDGTGYTLDFSRPVDQSSSRSLSYGLSLGSVTNTLGQSAGQLWEQYYQDGQRIGYDTFLKNLLPEGQESLSYYPIYFKELSPGCLEELESSWEQRELMTLDIRDLGQLSLAAGKDQAQEAPSEALPMISDPYCISLTQDGNWVMVLGIDQAAGYDYVQGLEVLSVECSGGDSWIHSQGGDGLPEGQVYEYVVGISPQGELAQPFTLSTALRLTLRDGSELELEFDTVFPQE